MTAMKFESKASIDLERFPNLKAITDHLDEVVTVEKSAFIHALASSAALEKFFYMDENLQQSVKNFQNFCDKYLKGPEKNELIKSALMRPSFLLGEEAWPLWKAYNPSIFEFMISDKSCLHSMIEFSRDLVKLIRFVQAHEDDATKQQKMEKIYQLMMSKSEFITTAIRLCAIVVPEIEETIDYIFDGLQGEPGLIKYLFGDAEGVSNFNLHEFTDYLLLRSISWPKTLSDKFTAALTDLSVLDEESGIPLRRLLSSPLHSVESTDTDGVSLAESEPYSSPAKPLPVLSPPASDEKRRIQVQTSFWMTGEFDRLQSYTHKASGLFNGEEEEDDQATGLIRSPVFNRGSGPSFPPRFFPTATTVDSADEDSPLSASAQASQVSTVLPPRAEQTEVQVLLLVPARLVLSAQW